MYRTANRRQPETGELRDIIKARNSSSEFCNREENAPYRYERGMIEAYFKSESVHIDHGVFRRLMRKNICGQWIAPAGAGSDYPPERRLVIENEEETRSLRVSGLVDVYDFGPVFVEISSLIDYHLSFDVEFIRSGYTIYPIVKRQAPRPSRMKSARSATLSWQ